MLCSVRMIFYFVVVTAHILKIKLRYLGLQTTPIRLRAVSTTLWRAPDIVSTHTIVPVLASSTWSSSYNRMEFIRSWGECPITVLIYCYNLVSIDRTFVCDLARPYDFRPEKKTLFPWFVLSTQVLGLIRALSLSSWEYFVWIHDENLLESTQYVLALSIICFSSVSSFGLRNFVSGSTGMGQQIVTMLCSWVAWW
jgi:hypothetical protein